MSDIIGEGPVTKGFLEEKLKEYFKTSNNLIKVYGNVISKGLGFTSDILRVHLTWDPPESLPTKVVVKAPKIGNMQKLLEDKGVSDVAQTSLQWIPMSHSTECKAYAILGAYHVLPLPKIYGSCPISEREPGVIIMEDLSDKGGIIGNVAEGVTIGQWRSVVEGLANLHGWSMVTEYPWQMEFPGSETIFDMMKGFMASTVANTKLAVEKYPEYLGHVDLDFLTEQLRYENLLETMTFYRRIMPDTMTHGDAWINNIFFEKNHDGSLSDKVLAFIDFQNCQRSCGILDLIRFEGWCVNHEMRRKYSLSMLRHYYDRLKSVAGEKLSATYEQIEEIYIRSTVLNAIYGVSGCEFFLSTVAKVDEDATGNRKKEILERIRASYDDAVMLMLDKRSEFN